RVGRTFRTAPPPRDEIQFDPDSLALGEGGETQAASPPPPRQQGSEEQEGNWLYDTPGIIKQHDVRLGTMCFSNNVFSNNVFSNNVFSNNVFILMCITVWGDPPSGLLSEQEVMFMVPTQALVPRTFVLQEGASLLVGGLARIDFIKGGGPCWFSVLVSSQIPVHISTLERVQEVYEKHAGHTLLGVPAGGTSGCREWGYQEAAGDLKLSSAGWVSVTAPPGDQLLLRLHGPEDASFSLRTPPLLPHLVKLKGDRVRKSVAYRTLKHVVLQREEAKKN
ncbi:hypothetical protein KUCAC02_037435, partial [Chaenocephalus aceratus]